jgi:hypothetical protein
MTDDNSNVVGFQDIHIDTEGQQQTSRDLLIGHSYAENEQRQAETISLPPTCARHSRDPHTQYHLGKHRRIAGALRLPSCMAAMHETRR